jgi:hypothetical protein
MNRSQTRLVEDEDMLQVGSKTLPGYACQDEMDTGLKAEDDRSCTPRLGPNYQTVTPRSKISFDEEMVDDERAGKLIWDPERAKKIDVDSFLTSRFIEKPMDIEKVPCNICSMEDALARLRKADYDPKKAFDKMELESEWWTVGMPLAKRWSPDDIMHFEAGFEYLSSLRSMKDQENDGIQLVRKKINKFEFIQRKFLPHKTIAEVISYYYHSKLDPSYSPQQKCQVVDILEHHDNFSFFCDSSDLSLPSEQLYNSWELDTPLYGVNDSFCQTRLKRSFDDFEDLNCPLRNNKRRRMLDNEDTHNTFVSSTSNDNDSTFWGLLVDV